MNAPLAAGVALAAAVLFAAPAAAADAAAVPPGEQLYSRCIACHAIDSNRTGPQHCGVFGRRAGTAPGYDAYSRAMRDSRIVWDEHTLDVFLRDPMQAVPGTTMGYAGIKNDEERAALIAWLKTASVPGKTCTPAR